MDILQHYDLTIEDLLPHRGNMLLVDEVLEVDNEHALTICRAAGSWPMAGEKGVPALILIELAAQTAGVCNGWDRVHTLGRDSDKTGWLVGVKEAEFHIEQIAFGEVVQSSARNTYNFSNLREVYCEQHINDALIATTTLQLFQA